MGLKDLAKDFAPLFEAAQTSRDAQQKLYKDSPLYREFCARSASFISRFLKKYEESLPFSEALGLARSIGESTEFCAAYNRKHRLINGPGADGGESFFADSIQYSASTVKHFHESENYDLPPLCHLRKIPRWEDFAAQNQGAQNA